MLITLTGVPSGNAGRRLESTSGHAALRSLADAAPSVIESPIATITFDLAGAMTCTPDTKKYIVVLEPGPAGENVASPQWSPATMYCVFRPTG